MARKKTYQRGPRRKRMTRQSRLDSARATAWVKQYGGKNIVTGYAKWYAVDPLCAVIELRMLGVNISSETESQIKASFDAAVAGKRRRKNAAEDAKFEDLYPDSNDIFAYIAGYTSNGVPYGVTWEELGEEPQWADQGNHSASR